MVYLFLTLILTISIGCQSKEKQSVESKLQSEIDLNELKSDTTECGLDGNLLKRIQDCQSKNPHLSRYQTKHSGVTWQQVTYAANTDFHVWLDTEQNLLWSSPIAPEKIDYCASVMTFKNGDRQISIRLPSFHEYKKFFAYLAPPLLVKRKARFFQHADAEEIKMVADERTQTFRNSPDDEPVWIRCLGD